MNPRNIAVLAACVAVPLAVGLLSGLATASGVEDWYPGLRKPAFNPPNWVFGPMWTLLYVLMGISLYWIWTAPRGRARARALIVFAIQLALNCAWSFLFFAFHKIGIALVEIALIWCAVLLMIFVFRQVHKPAALLQVPYLLWVTFATVLNAALWRLN